MGGKKSGLFLRLGRARVEPTFAPGTLNVLCLFYMKVDVPFLAKGITDITWLQYLILE